ncbi:MAG: 2-amino-4-hydroxy-6-hydroxymethyldihydropteridine diphosphokinase [Verrucomicrobiota bacterium]
MNPARAGIALGSNLGDRLKMLQNARDRIRTIAGVQPPIAQSAIYRTTPVNCEAKASDFYNAVIEIGFQNSAQLLLAALREIEVSLGRAPEHRRNVSRTIDLDLLYFGELQLGQELLQLPHPRMTQRAFVLRPLADIQPDLRLPGQTATVRELLARLDPGEAVTRLIDKW